MTARTVAGTNTLEDFRTSFNSLSSTDIGDPATLTTTATSIVGAVNEINAGVAKFTIRDSSSTTQEVVANAAGGDTFNFAGDTNITTTVSNPDTLTVTLNTTITGISSFTSTTISGTNINATGTMTLNSVGVATQPFAIAQAIALG